MKNLKSKSLLTMLMVLALLVATASMAFADFNAFLVKADDGKFYEYNSQELNDSYTAFQVLGATSPQAAMYNQFVAIGGSTKVVALNDSVKGWMDYAAAQTANIAAQIAEVPFVINDYFATPAATLYGGTVTNPIVVNPDGTLAPTVDLAAYEAARAQAEAVVAADYTAATYAALQTALTDNVVDGTNTQIEIDAATAAINDAYAALVKVLEVESVSAINSKEVEVTFNKEVKEVKPANFKVTDKDGNLLFVSKAVLNEAKTVATLSFFDAFADKGVYSVETSNVADVDGNVMTKSTDQFGYEKSEVATVEFTSKTIKVGGKLADVVKVTDKLGRDVTAENVVEFASADTSIIDNTGEAQAGQDGKEVLVTATVKGTTVTAKSVVKVSNSSAKTFVGYTLDLAANTAADTDAFNKLEADKIYDHVSVSDKAAAAKTLTVYALDQYGKNMTKVNTFESVENLTPNVAIVSATDGKITPISEGTAYVKVKVGAIEQTLKINVRAEAKVQDIEVDPTAVEVVEKGIAGNIKLTYKNQFGGTTAGTNANLTVKSSDTAVATVSKTDVNNIAVTGLKAGTTNVTLTYKYKVGTEDVVIEKVVPVTVSEKGSFADYKVEVSRTTLYSEDDADTTTVNEINVDVKVYELDDKGQKIGVATGTSLQAIKLDAEGEVVNDGTGTAVTVSGLNVAYNAAGTQKVQVKVGSVVLETIEFTSVNNTPGIASTVELDNTAVLAGEFGGVGYEASVNELLEGIVILKDKFGDKVTVGASDTFAFEYIITNKDGVTFDGTANTAETIETVTKKNATADVVLTSVIFTPSGGSATENLVKDPQVIKLSVKDTTAPGVDFASSSAITNLVLDVDEDLVYADEAELKAHFELKVAAAGSTATITSAKYDKSAKTITFVIADDGASAKLAENDTISVKATLTDVAGNGAEAGVVAKVNSTPDAWITK